jgi:radical SAM protein with 4Fe4S-binding SPASM domain
MAVIKEFASFAMLHRRPGVVYLTGGEPLLRNDILELLECCSRYGLYSRLLTNGTLLDKEKIGGLRSHHIGAVQISLDGLSETHDAVRGSGCFQDGKRSIERTASRDIPVTVMTTVNRNNFMELTTLWSECLAVGAKRLAFGRLVPTGRGASLVEALLSPEECLGLYSDVLDFESTEANGAQIVKRDPLWRILDARCYANCGTTGCSIGLNGLCILQNGDVLPCRRLPIVLGNIRKDSIYTIWTRSTLLAQCRERHLNGACATCRLRMKCGGCRGIAHAFTGDPLATDPQCFLSEINR